MKPDDPVCLCFHVSRRKVENFIRIEKPRKPSQLSECYGAGTGCGWCRPYLERLLYAQIRPDSNPESTDTEQADWDDLDQEIYAQGRAKHVKEGGKSLPPGATPIPDELS